MLESLVPRHNKTKTQQSKKLALAQGEGENNCMEWVPYSIQSLHMQYVREYNIYV
jgi:hypothetical protein